MSIRTTKTTPYSTKQIAYELVQTALGNSYFGNALYVAKDIPILNDDDRWVIQRWLTGSQVASDGFLLQQIAMKIEGYE